MRYTQSFFAIVTALSLLSTLASCGESNGKKSQPLKPLSATESSANNLPIAYVRLDSLYAGYQYYKDVTGELAKIGEANRQQLTAKMQTLKKAAEDFQRKAKINAFVSAEAQEAEQLKLMNMEEQGRQLEAKLTQEFMLRQQQENEKLNEIIRKEIAAFNNGRYRYILTDLGGQNILYADSTLDITGSLVDYLNANYKKTK